MKNEVPRNAATIVGIIDRPNELIYELAYRKDSVAEVKKQTYNVWDSTSKNAD